MIISGSVPHPRGLKKKTKEGQSCFWRPGAHVPLNLLETASARTSKGCSGLQLPSVLASSAAKSLSRLQPQQLAVTRCYCWWDYTDTESVPAYWCAAHSFCWDPISELKGILWSKVNKTQKGHILCDSI